MSEMEANEESRTDRLETPKRKKKKKKKTPIGETDPGMELQSQGTEESPTMKEIEKYDVSTASFNQNGLSEDTSQLKSKKKKRKRSPAPDALDVEHRRTVNWDSTVEKRELPPAPGSTLRPLPDALRHKKKKGGSRIRRISGPAEINEFEISPQDIVDNGAVDNTGGKQPIVANLISQPMEKVFVERLDGRGFIGENRFGLRERDVEASQHEFEMASLDPTTSDFAVQVLGWFWWLALLCHGLVAGYSLWQCIGVYLLSNASDLESNFLLRYENASLAVQCIYYFLLAVCCVSVLDGYESAHAHSESNLLRKFQLRPSYTLAVIVYFIGIIFSLSIASIDARISAYSSRPDQWTDFLTVDNTPIKDCSLAYNEVCYKDGGGSSTRLTTWRVLNTIRAICALLGWLLVASQAKRIHAPDYLFHPEKDGEKSTPL